MMRSFRALVMLPPVTMLCWSIFTAPVLAQAQPPAAAPVPTPAPAQAPDMKDYIVGAEDILDVQVWDNKDLNQVVFVRPDGKTSLPLVGEIQAAGKTVQELQDYLTAMYSKTVKGAAVTVIIREIKSRPVYFLGGFGRPGALQLLRTDLTLLQALALVGGVTPAADADKGFVLRKDKVIP